MLKAEKDNVPINTVSAEWTLLCVGIRTRPMGGRTFVLIYWSTQASVDETERASSTSECRRNVNEICSNLAVNGASKQIIKVLVVGLKKTESVCQTCSIKLYNRNQTSNNPNVADEAKRKH